MRLSILASAFASLLAFSAVSVSAQTITGLAVPQIAHGGASNRLATGVLARIDGLDASKTYRYVTQAVTIAELAEAPAITNGAGNPLFVASPNFSYSTSPGFTTAGAYGEFTTDVAGSYTGWFGIVATGNARFADGEQFHVRLRYNDGNGGTAIVGRLTVGDSITSRLFGATATNSTGMRAVASPFAAKNWVALYDNTTGTGRPLSVAPVHAIGATVASSAAFYTTGVENVATAWAASLPNSLPNGLRRIEERDALGNLITTITDDDGTWPSGANTVNPTGGTTAINLVNPADFPVITPSSADGWSLSQ